MIIMRLTDLVMLHTGLGRSSIFKFIAAGTFPKPVPLGDRAVGWVKSEIEDWIMNKIADRDKRLVAS